MPLGPKDEPFVSNTRNEFVYGLGEARGGVLRTGRRFTLEARDGASYDLETGASLGGWCCIFSHLLLLSLIGDPLYKVTPFYIIFNKKTQIWCGVFYNSLANDASIDLGAECDALFSMFTPPRFHNYD